MDDLREKRATLAHGSQGQGSVYVWWGGTVVEADHGRGLWCGFVYSLPDQRTEEDPEASYYNSHCLLFMVCLPAKHHVSKISTAYQKDTK